ncbi:hypothetical protein ASPFODRAFT_137117 [Aspergillus luchuensis CBS 106.47]|uniref:Uncharacterized protein n=1 Tax=Aspergillus luchuensis (strain CBS 106.47) TaxID=1137211 RepID=A0A1M3TDX6_ASPLC|nr:hypothetical protein ASPFODRAFT_137117 [Aspergillus luchuensis CBS 106.47]
MLNLQSKSRRHWVQFLIEKVRAPGFTVAEYTEDISPHELNVVLYIYGDQIDKLLNDRAFNGERSGSDDSRHQWGRCGKCNANSVIIDFPKSLVRSQGTYSVPFESTRGTCPTSKKKRGVYAGKSMVVQPCMGCLLPITYSHHIPDDTLLQLEPIPVVASETNCFGSLPGTLVTSDNGQLPYTNLGECPIRLEQGQLIAYISSPGAVAATPTVVYVAQVADNANISAKRKEGDDDVDLNRIKIPIAIPEFDATLLTEADVSNAWGEEYACQVHAVLDKHSPLFHPELGRFTGKKMGIPFHDKRDIKGLKQNPYSLTYRDRAAMDGVLDPLHQTGQVEKVPLDRPSPVSSSVFVV